MSEKIFKFNIIAFLVTFILGILYVYMDTPKERIVIKYPTPYNADKIVYKGLNGDCYKFKVNQVECKENAIDQPII